MNDDSQHLETMSHDITIVREGGFEPPRPGGHWHLKPARLPFRHSRAPRKATSAHERRRYGA